MEKRGGGSRLLRCADTRLTNRRMLRRPNGVKRAGGKEPFGWTSHRTAAGGQGQGASNGETCPGAKGLLAARSSNKAVKEPGVPVMQGQRRKTERDVPDVLFEGSCSGRVPKDRGGGGENVGCVGGDGVSGKTGYGGVWGLWMEFVYQPGISGAGK